MQTETAVGSDATLSDARTRRRVILAASLGTLFEWYDFFLYGSLFPNDVVHRNSSTSLVHLPR